MQSDWYRISIKTKILLGFGSAIVILVIAGAISYSSFKDLMRSLNYLSKPEIKLIKCNELLSDLSLSESNIRSYFISNEKKYLNNYHQYCQQLKNNIDSLKILTHGSRDTEDKILKISALWEEKKKHTQDLISLYKNREDKKLPDGILTQLNKDNPDEPSIVITKTITINKKEVYLKKNSKDKTKITEEKRNLFDRIFKKKEKEEKEIEKTDSVVANPISKNEVSTLVDTLHANGDASEIREEKFTKLLSNIRQHNSKSRKEIKDNEKELTQKDIGLIEYIGTTVIELKDSEQRHTEKQISEAKKIVELSIMKLLLLGLSSIGSILVLGFIIVNDVNKTNYQKHQLIQDKIQAEELVKAKESFLANMSHEIRTPLNSIVGFTEQLSQTHLQNKQKYYLQAVSNSSSHLLSLVNDILDHSRIEAGKIDFEETSFYLKDIMEEVINVFHIKASEKELDLSYKINGSRFEYISGDSLRLKQILFNLVSNAIKFTHKGSVIINCDLLPISENETSLIATIADTGIGIPKENIERIFETFTQADSSISRKFGGTGLGLAISKKLVELQGGRIVVKSTEGLGSEFTFCIKYKKGKDLVHYKIENQEYNSELLSGLQILIVEDDEFNLLLFHTILIKWNCRVTMAGNSDEAMQYLSKETYDIIITDIHMPGMSGVDLFKWIKSHADKRISETPVLAVTANVIKESMKVYKDSGFNGILLKPFKEVDLANAIISINNEINKDHSVYKKIDKINPNEESNLFSDFINYSGGNTEIAKDIINAFISSNYTLLEQVDIGFKNSDWKQLKTAVHKLNPGFGHLHNYEITALLAEVELYLEEEPKPDSKKLEENIQIILETGYKQMDEVERERKKLNLS